MTDRQYIAWVLVKVLARICGAVVLVWLTWKFIPILVRGE